MKKIEIIYSRSAYGHDKKHVQIIKDDEFKYPLVYTITEKDGVLFHYSKTNKNGHFGVPKLILKFGAINTLLDLEGEYGMTQYACAIVDTPDNLVKIQQAVETENFRKLEGYFCGDVDRNAIIDVKGVMFKFMKEFRKDFWKDWL